jgi:hypothetical protein
VFNEMVGPQHVDKHVMEDFYILIYIYIYDLKNTNFLLISKETNTFIKVLIQNC